MPTFHEVQHAFGLTHVTVADIEHAHAIDVHEAAVNHGMGRKEFFQDSLGNLVKLVSVERRREQRDVQTVTHRPKFRVRHLRMSHHPHGRLVYRQILKDPGACLGPDRFQIVPFGMSHHLNLLGTINLGKARHRKTRPMNAAFGNRRL